MTHKSEMTLKQKIAEAAKDSALDETEVWIPKAEARDLLEELDLLRKLSSTIVEIWEPKEFDEHGLADGYRCLRAKVGPELLIDRPVSAVRVHRNKVTIILAALITTSIEI